MTFEYMELPGEVNTSELATLLGCDHRQVGLYARAGLVRPSAPDRWPLAATVSAIARHLQDAAVPPPASTAEPDGGGPSAVAALARLAHARRRKIEREEAEALANLLDAREARDAWKDEQRAVRAALMALPDQAAQQVVALDNFHAVRTVLVDAITATLQALADDDGPVVPEPPEADA